MFERITYADWLVVFPIVAFVVASAIFGALSWRALRMRRADVERFARLPLQDDSDPAFRHE